MIKKSLILLFLMLIPLASAELQLEELSQDVYNLGEKISLTAYATNAEDAAAFIKAKITCGEYELPYYMAPVSLKANEEKTISIPELEAESSLLGSCGITVSLETTSSVLASADTSEFTISKDLKLSAEIEKAEFDPGETAKIDIDLTTQYGFVPDPMNMDVLLDELIISTLTEEQVVYEVTIPGDAKSGEHSITVRASDEKGNSGEISTSILVNQIPTKIETNLEKQSFIPSETISLATSLLDQAGDLITKSSTVTITGPEGNLIYDNEGETHTYIIEWNAEPGTYNIFVDFGTLSENIPVTVEEYLNFDIKLEEGIVSIKNTGNIPYEGRNDIYVKTETSEKTVKNKLNLQPGEEKQIDLREKLKKGDYNVLIPAYNSETKGFSYSQIDSAYIDGKAGFLSGVFGITGAVVTVGGLLPPSIAAIIVVVIILSLAFYYYKKDSKGGSDRDFKREDTGEGDTGY